MKDLRIGLRLVGAFVFVSLLTVACGFIGYLGIMRAESAVETLTDDTLPSLISLGEVRYNLSSEIVALRSLLLPTLQDRPQQHNNLDKALADAEKALKDFEATPKSDADKANWEAFRGLYADMRKAVETANGLLKDWEANPGSVQKYEAATDFITVELNLKSRATLNLLGKIMEQESGYATSEKQLARENGARSSRNMILVMVACPVLALVLGLLLNRSITRPLGQAVAFAGAVAEGRLDENLAVRQKDEVGRLAESLRVMVGNLRQKIGEAEEASGKARQESEAARKAMAEAEEARKQAERAKREGLLQAAGRLQGVAEVLTTASEGLAAQIEQSSQGAENQSRRVGDTATAMEEMNATVLEVAKSAAGAADTSDGAKHKAQQGAEVVGEVVSSIGQVRAEALELRGDMGKLGSQAEDIGRVMNVISDIADQTNLLALNAAIEAARAGDAGRGFAVVADEVRKLAEKTMAATKEVGEAIQGIQQGTRRNVENVERSAKRIEEVTGLANRSGEALGEIVRLVDQVSDQVRSIATASEEQSSASDEINKSIEEISTISNQTAQTMTQAARAVSDLAAQAQALRSLIEELQAEGRG